MTLTAILTQAAQDMYSVTEKLFRLVEEDKLAWKPETGSNWMTTGQLMKHCTEACGTTVRGFVTGDWGMPEGMSMADMPPEEMMPPAEKMPSVKSVGEAIELLAADRALAIACIQQAGEENLISGTFAAPWGGPELTLFQHIYEMIWHLGQHKGQLFYYLKLQGHEVNTMTLWMPEPA